MICQRAAEILSNFYLAASRSNLIGCSGEMVLNFINLSMFFIKHRLKIMCARFRDYWTKFVIGDAF